MKIHTSLIALALLALTFAGCSKHSPDTTATHQKVLDFGVVEVSDGVQSRHDLGGGRVCIITPTIQKDGSVLLSCRVEESGKFLTSLGIKTLSDHSVTVSVKDISFGLTPHIKQ